MNRLWVVDDDAFLRAHFGKLSYREISLALGVSKDTVRYHCYQLCLLRRESMIRSVRDQEYMERMRREVGA